jgi:hypothetical protein
MICLLQNVAGTELRRDRAKHSGLKSLRYQIWPRPSQEKSARSELDVLMVHHVSAIAGDSCRGNRIHS